MLTWTHVHRPINYTEIVCFGVPTQNVKQILISTQQQQFFCANKEEHRGRWILADVDDDLRYYLVVARIHFSGKEIEYIQRMQWKWLKVYMRLAHLLNNKPIQLPNSSEF